MLKPSAFLLGCTLLCGCTTVGPDFERPAPPKVASYAMPGEPAPRLKLEPQSAPSQWWTAFGSDQLNVLVEMDAQYAEIARARLAYYADPLRHMEAA